MCSELPGNHREHVAESLIMVRQTRQIKCKRTKGSFHGLGAEQQAALFRQSKGLWRNNDGSPVFIDTAMSELLHVIIMHPTAGPLQGTTFS